MDSRSAKASKSSDAAAVDWDRPRSRNFDATASVVPPRRLNESHARRIESAAASGEGAGARGDDASSSSSSSARGRAPAARRRATVRRRSRKEDRFAEAASIFRRCASASSDWCLARFTAALRTRRDAALALARVCSSASSCEEWVRGGERAACEVREETVAESRIVFSGRPRQTESLGFLGFGTRETSCLATVFLPVLTGLTRLRWRGTWLFCAGTYLPLALRRGESRVDPRRDVLGGQLLPLEAHLQPLGERRARGR